MICDSQRMKAGMSMRFFLIAGLLMAIVLPGQAAEWRQQLSNGQPVSVDTRTNRVRVWNSDGESMPLWDGVHRLSDGSTITVRRGLVVPTESIISARDRKPPRRRNPPRDFSCRELIGKVCGEQRQCASMEPCRLAGQLSRFEAEERAALQSSGQASAIGTVPAQCRQALADEAQFPPCQKLPPRESLTACGRLERRVCGDAAQCAGDEACQLARQLEKTELDERVAAGDMKKDTPASADCRRALRDSVAFPECGFWRRLLGR